MDAPCKMLSGSQLVAKGAIREAQGVQGQIPEVGLKFVSPNGSWLERKQIQVALEARKHLIAVERIQKSGSLSHAAWRDDLKLAEVTKQSGGHWQYIGHTRGKCMYLLPEETLFLLETNNLLLKHNDVTVSLQKAYSLCLSEISITQYQVYASLSRLGYRVFRHNELADTTAAGYQLSDALNTQQVESQNVSSKADANMNVSKRDASEVSRNNTNIDIPVNNEDATAYDSTVNAGSNSAVIDENSTRSNDNSIVNEILSEENKKKAVPMLVGTNSLNESISGNSASVLSMDIDDNANENTITSYNKEDVMVTNTDGNESAAKVSIGRDSTPYATVAGDAQNIQLAAVYSVDEFGVIQPFETDAPIETASSDLNIVNAATDSTDGTPKTTDSIISDAFKHLQFELKLYDDKIKKFTERKSNADQRNNQALMAMHDYYKENIVKVNVPDERYLPRNIFLHKTEYTLNMEVVSTQNASNVNEETDATEPPPTFAHSSNLQSLSGFPRFGNFNSHYHTQLRNPTYHQRFHFNQRLHFNPIFRTMPNFYTYPRYYPNTYIRHHHMVYNVQPTRNNATRDNYHNLTKNHYYDMIVNIANRLKNGLIIPSQVRAVHSLVNTYNSRYKTKLRLAPDFTIAETPDTAEEVIELDSENVINLDDGPKRKKPRLNDDSIKYKRNLERLKELAAKLKELEAKNLAVSRHRRVFSNAIKTFNKSFNADLYLDSNTEIVDRTTVVVDTSSDSDVVVVKEKSKGTKRKRLRNPYSILKGIPNDVNVGASTSRQVPMLRKLPLHVIDDNAATSHTTSGNTNMDSTVVLNKDEGLLKDFFQARFSGDDFSGAQLCSRVVARFDALLFHAVYLHDVLSESRAEFKSWVEIKLAILKDIRRSLKLQKHQVEALRNDFITTESRIQPILPPDCQDLKCALKKLSIIQRNIDAPAETKLKIHFDVCNRDVHYRKTDPPKPNFRVICYDESAPFPSQDDVMSIEAKHKDGIQAVIAFVGNSGSISYLHMNTVDLDMFIPEEDIVTSGEETRGEV